MPKPLRVAGTALSALALTLAIVIALATIVIPKLMGATPYTVLTGSMRPTMEPGALAIVQPVDAAQIQAGDVITYQIAPNEPAVVTHRVIGVNTSTTGERTFTTQGDANSTPDSSPVLPAQIRGSVAYSVPWMGHVNSTLNAGSRSWLLVVAAGALIAYGLGQVASGIRARSRRKRAKPGTRAARRWAQAQ